MAIQYRANVISRNEQNHAHSPVVADVFCLSRCLQASSSVSSVHSHIPRSYSHSFHDLQGTVPFVTSSKYYELAQVGWGVYVQDVLSCECFSYYSSVRHILIDFLSPAHRSPFSKGRSRSDVLE